MSVITPDTTPVESHFFHPWAELDVPSNQLYIYKEDDYQGDQWNLQFDMSDQERAYYFQLKGTGFNDEISSWKLGRNIWAEFCKDDLVWDESATEANPHFTCQGAGEAPTPDWHDHVLQAEGIGHRSNQNWDDLPFIKEVHATDEIPTITRIDYYNGDGYHMRGMQTFYTDDRVAPLHVNEGDWTLTSFTIPEGERIVEVITREGDYIAEIKLKLTNGTVIGVEGFPQENPLWRPWTAPDGCFVIGFAGENNVVEYMSGFEVHYICEEDYLPRSAYVGSAAGEAAVSSWQPNDDVSGVILHLYDAATNPAATVYTGQNCTGRSAALFTNNLQPKSYNQEALSNHGLPDGSVASFMAPVGVWVHAFDDGALTGGDFKNEMFPGQEDKDGWMVCQNFDAEWSNTISSLQISWVQPAPVRGKWIMIGEGEHTHKYYSGFFTAESDKPATVSQGDLLASFEVGLEFINRHCSVHQLVSEDIRMATYVEMSAAFEKTEVQMGLCPPRLPLDGKIGYFVYVVETQDGDASIINAQGVCRYGDDWDVAPLCPPAACLDDECNECAEWY